MVLLLISGIFFPLQFQGGRLVLVTAVGETRGGQILFIIHERSLKLYQFSALFFISITGYPTVITRLFNDYH